MVINCQSALVHAKTLTQDLLFAWLAITPLLLPLGNHIINKHRNYIMSDINHCIITRAGSSPVLGNRGRFSF